MSEVLSYSQFQEAMDAVYPKAVKKKFKNRKDKDIDNDGDVDSSDKYLHKRRKAISKAVKKDDVKEEKKSPPGQYYCEKSGECKPNSMKKEETLKEKGKGLYYNINKKRKEGRPMRKKGEKGAPSEDDFKSAAKTAKESQEWERENCHSKDHDCATLVEHIVWGIGKPLFERHAVPDDSGYVAWYDIEFEHGVESAVPTEDLKIYTTEAHEKKDKTWNEQADRFFNYMMDNFETELVVMGAKIALTNYKLPFDPSKLKSFDRFHKKFGKYVITAMESK